MSLLDVLRAKFPDNEKLKALSDPDIVSTLAQATGKDLPYVADKLGLPYADYVQNEGFWEDTGSDVAVGVSDIPGVAAGIVDLVNPLAWAGTDYTLSKGWDAVEDATGLADWRARQEVTLSPERLAQEQAVAEAFKNEGLGAAAWEALTSPRAFVGAAARSLPASLASGFGLGMPLRAAATARGMDRLAKVAPWLAEGAHAGGAGVDQATEAGVDPAMANLVGLGTGVTTGALGGTIGATARRFGIDDVQAAMAGAGRTAEVTRPLYQRIPMTAGVEMAQEVPQSGTEQMWQNYAQGKPLMEDVAHQAVMGGLAGGVMGAGFGLFPRGRKIDSNTQTDLLQDDQLDPTKGLDTSRVNAPSVGAGIRNLAGLNTAEGLSNWAGVQGPSDTAGYTSDLTASYNEPSGHRVADKVTGVERELSMGDWLYYQATGQLPPTADPVKVEGKPKPVEGVTPETQRLLDVAKNLPMAADPAKVRPGEVSANGHRASGRPTKDAVNWATTLSGLKTEDEVNKAVEKGTRSKAGYWQWVMPMAAARIQEIKAEQAKQSAANTGRPNPDTSTEADAKTRVNPTTSSVVAPDGVNAVPEGGPAPVVQDEVSPSGDTIPSEVSPSGATSSGSPVLDMALEIPYEAPVWDQATGTTTKTSGTSKILDYGGRKLIVLNINGVQVPFYQSSGQAGKKNVPAGKWYPILGIDPDSGWINKGTEADITSYYGSDLLRQYAEMLDNEIGDIRSRDTDPKVGMRGPQLAFVNQGLNPTPNEAGAYAKLQDNLVNLMGRLGYKPNEPGATPSPTAPTNAAPADEVVTEWARHAGIDPETAKAELWAIGDADPNALAEISAEAVLGKPRQFTDPDGVVTEVPGRPDEYQRIKLTVLRKQHLNKLGIKNDALSGQTTSQAGQETGTTAPDATTEPGVTGEPGVKQKRTARPKKQGKSFVAPGMGQTTTVDADPTTVEVPQYGSREEVNQATRRRYGELVNTLPALKSATNKVRLKQGISDTERQEVVDTLAEAFVDYINVIADTRGVGGTKGEGLDARAAELAKRLEGKLVKVEGTGDSQRIVPLKPTAQWIRTNMRLLHSRAAGDGTLQNLRAQSDALLAAEQEAIKAGTNVTGGINSTAKVMQAGLAMGSSKANASKANVASAANVPDDLVNAWATANGLTPTQAKRELLDLPKDERGPLVSAMEARTNKELEYTPAEGETKEEIELSEAESKKNGPHRLEVIDNAELYNFLRNVRTQYQAAAKQAETEASDKRALKEVEPVITDTFEAGYEQHRAGSEALPSFTALKSIIPPQGLSLYRALWGKATTPEARTEAANRIKKAHDNTLANRAKRAEQEQQRATPVEPQPVAASGDVDSAGTGTSVVGEEPPGGTSGVRGPDGSPGGTGVRRAGDAGQGEGTGRPVAGGGKGAAEGGVTAKPTPKRAAKPVPPELEGVDFVSLDPTGTAARLKQTEQTEWRDAANQDFLTSGLPRLSTGTAFEEFSRVLQALAKQGIDAIRTWRSRANRDARGLAELRQAMLIKAGVLKKKGNLWQYQPQRGVSVVAENPTTGQSLRDTIASLLGKGHNWRIHVYADPEAAYADGHTEDTVGNAYGWVEADQKGVKHAYFIVNRIEQGTELGKFLHEVGAHIGLENILSPALYQNLVGQLRKWAALNNDSLESRLAKAALARVQYAQEQGGVTNPNHELIAYFLEEAVKAGVDPTATRANSPLGTWFMRLWTAFKRALRKLRIENLDQLQPQHVVDLAYGAARLSLVERKNAAPQRVTEAMPTQYGVDIPSHITSAKEAVHNALSDTYTGANRGLLGWMGINNIAERFGETLPILKSIEKTFNEMSHQAKLWLDRGDQIERMWSMLTPKQTELVSFIAGNATILQFDPSKDQANTPEKQEIAQKWKELQALDAANPKAKGTTTILAAVRHYQDVHKESLAYLEDVLKQAQAAGASTHAIESVRDTVKALKKKQTHFWLPLHRFGDFHSVAMSPTLFALHQRHQQHLEDVRANKANPAAWSKDDDKLFRKLRKDPKHYEAMGHESERAARRRATHWQGKGWQATSNINRYTSDQARAHLKPEIEAFEKMLAHTKLDAKVANKLIDSYTDLLIEALPENHILKRQLDREGIAGWDPDMKRAFAKTAQSQAFAMSRLLHARKLGEQLGQLERQGDSFQPHATLARDLHAELIKQQELAMTRSEDPYWVRFATGFNYMAMLGGSPFFWALQLAQVPTITLPYLIGRNNANVTDTMGKLATAWGQAKDFVKWSVEANEWRAELDFSRAVKGVTPEEMQALKEMDEAGRFVFTIGQDLGAAADGRNTKTARFIRSINTPTHTTELINRVSTGLAAYRISRKNGSAPKAAVEFALRTIDNTQVNMDPVMGARNLKTLFGRQGTQPFAKIIFQFWKFQQGMAYTTLTTMKDAWTHPDPALRKQARDSAIGLTVSLMTTSGIFGLPFVGTGMMLLSFLAGLDGDDDEDDNIERLVKNWLKESPLPEVVADTLNKGFLSAILPTDAAPYLSPRFGLGTLMNPLGYARFDDAERGEDMVKELMFRVLGGPTGSSAAAFWDGIQAGLDGDYAKATEKMVPLKLMRDLARAYTLADQGVSTGKGEERIDPDDMSTMSWIWQAMGVTPMKKAMYHEGQAGVQALKTAVTGEREKLLARHAQARLKGEDVSAVTRDILRFNQKHPYARIKAENLRQAFGRRRDNQRKLTDTGILADKQNLPYLGNAAWTR